MSANPPILTIPRQRPEPEEHIHRYLDSIHQHQPEHIVEGHRQFRKEEENGFSEVASYWARGDSSSQGKFSEEVMGRRGRAGSSPPRMGPSRGVERHTRELRTYASVPAPIEPPVRRSMGVRKALDERFEGNLEIAERWEQRTARRREKAAIRRPHPPSPPPPLTTQLKRLASNQGGSEWSGSQSQEMLPPKRRGQRDGMDVIRHFEASNVAVKRLTMRPEKTKGFLGRGVASAPARPTKRRITSYDDQEGMFEEDRLKLWRRPSRPAVPSENPDRPAERIPARPFADRPRFASADSAPQGHQAHRVPYAPGELPPPGRTNSPSWPSEMRSSSTRSRPLPPSTSPPPPSVSRPFPSDLRLPTTTAFSPSPFASVAHQSGPARPIAQLPRRTPRPVFGENTPLLPPEPSHVPLPLFHLAAPSHVDHLATDLAQNLRLRRRPSVDSAPRHPSASSSIPHRPMIAPTSRTVPPARIGALGRTPMITLQPEIQPISLERQKPLISHISYDSPPAEPTSSAYQNPLIHPVNYTSSPSEAPSLSAQAQPRTTPRAAGSPDIVRNRPIIKLQRADTSPPDMALPLPLPLVMHSAETDVSAPTARLDQLFTPPRPPLPPPHSREPTPPRARIRLDTTHDNPFLSEQNPFITFQHVPSPHHDEQHDTGVQKLAFPFSSPPLAPSDLAPSAYSYLAEPYDYCHGGMAEEIDAQWDLSEWEAARGEQGEREERRFDGTRMDCKDFWKARPAVI